MAQVIVRKLDPEVVAALKRRAEGKGRRLEQELRSRRGPSFWPKWTRSGHAPAQDRTWTSQR